METGQGLASRHTTARKRHAHCDLRSRGCEASCKRNRVRFRHSGPSQCCENLQPPPNPAATCVRALKTASGGDTALPRASTATHRWKFCAFATRSPTCLRSTSRCASAWRGFQICSTRHYARIRKVDRLNDEHGTVVLMSDGAAGVRLIEILTEVERAGRVLDLNAALYLVRQLISAISALHQHARVAHGAIAPERLFVTPRGRVCSLSSTCWARRSSN